MEKKIEKWIENCNWKKATETMAKTLTDCKTYEEYVMCMTAICGTWVEGCLAFQRRALK